MGPIVKMEKVTGKVYIYIYARTGEINYNNEEAWPESIIRIVGVVINNVVIIADVHYTV